jgi:hypothetical protein
MVRIARIADTDAIHIRKLDLPVESTGMDFSGVIRYSTTPPQDLNKNEILEGRTPHE